MIDGKRMIQSEVMNFYWMGCSVSKTGEISCFADKLRKYTYIDKGVLVHPRIRDDLLRLSFSHILLLKK